MIFKINSRKYIQEINFEATRHVATWRQFLASCDFYAFVVDDNETISR